ncbi:MAG: hypothetical protein IT462_12420 [Planctomycetes bacterium]|nr:hypothetical protein [Planctomycetota bacterium]
MRHLAVVGLLLCALSGCSINVMMDGSELATLMIAATEAQPVDFLHEGAALGQWWETRAVEVSTNRKGQRTVKESTSRYQVVGQEGDRLLVENVRDSMVFASLVDPSLDRLNPSLARANFRRVERAWVGVSGERPIEQRVAKWPGLETGDGSTMLAPGVTETPFSGLVIAGKSWSGTMRRTTMNAGKYTRCEWLANDGWFHRKVMSTEESPQGSTKEVLVGWGTDAQPALNWRLPRR